MQQIADRTLSQLTLALPPDPELIPGSNRVVFAMLNKSGGFVPGLNIEMYIARAQSAVAIGPVAARFEDDGLGDRSFYRADLKFPKIGKWLMIARERGKERLPGGGATVEVKATTAVVRLGQEAISLQTPTVSDGMGLPDICSRDPEDPMHGISLDKALLNGKPTVVVIASPFFCESRVCGPVVDQVLRVREAFPEDANYIHVEVYTDLTNGEITKKPFTPIMAAYHLQSEPWTFVFDKDGTVRGRFEGPVTTTEIKDVLLGLI